MMSPQIERRRRHRCHPRPGDKGSGSGNHGGGRVTCRDTRAAFLASVAACGVTGVTGNVTGKATARVTRNIGNVRALSHLSLASPTAPYYRIGERPPKVTHAIIRNTNNISARVWPLTSGLRTACHRCHMLPCDTLRLFGNCGGRAVTRRDTRAATEAIVGVKGVTGVTGNVTGCGDYPATDNGRPARNLRQSSQGTQGRKYHRIGERPPKVTQAMRRNNNDTRARDACDTTITDRRHPPQEKTAGPSRPHPAPTRSKGSLQQIHTDAVAIRACLQDALNNHSKAN